MEKIIKVLENNGFIINIYNENLIATYTHNDIDTTIIIAPQYHNRFYAVATDDIIDDILSNYIKKCMKRDGQIYSLPSLASSIFYNKLCERSEYLYLWNNDHSEYEIISAINDFMKKIK
jgi:hypothetical protein